MACDTGIRTKFGLEKLSGVHFCLSWGTNREIELNILYDKGHLNFYRVPMEA